MCGRRMKRTKLMYLTTSSVAITTSHYRRAFNKHPLTGWGKQKNSSLTSILYWKSCKIQAVKIKKVRFLMDYVFIFFSALAKFNWFNLFNFVYSDTYSMMWHDQQISLNRFCGKKNERENGIWNWMLQEKLSIKGIDVPEFCRFKTGTNKTPLLLPLILNFIHDFSLFLWFIY